MLGKKKTKELTQALRKKLTALGVENKTEARQIGKKPALTMNDGKIEQILVPVVQLQNLQERMIKQLLAGGENVVRQFIAMSNESLRGAFNQQTTPEEAIAADVEPVVL